MDNAGISSPSVRRRLFQKAARLHCPINGTFELTDGEGAPLDAEMLSGEKGVQPIDGGGWGVRFSAVWAVPDASPLPQTLL